jgi:hypothetical protein
MTVTAYLPCSLPSGPGRLKDVTVSKDIVKEQLNELVKAAAG